MERLQEDTQMGRHHPKASRANSGMGCHVPRPVCNFSFVIGNERGSDSGHLR